MRKLVIDGITSNYYLVREDGAIFNIEGKQLKAHITWNGYARVRLQRDLSRGMYLVHRLVASTYLDNPNDLPIVNHKDNDRLNNHYTNLEWCNNSHNQKQRFETHRGTKRKEVLQYSLEDEFIKEWDSPIDVFNKLGIAHQNISKVCRGLRTHAGGYKWKYK